MHRAFMKPDMLGRALAGQDFKLDPETAKRFTRVLRLQDGTSVEIFDGTGRIITGVLNQTVLKNIQISQVELKGPYIKLYQALIAMDKLEQITQHSTELGVSEIILFKSERSQVDFKDKIAGKLERLTRIAQDASRQCGRADVPMISWGKSLLTSPFQREEQNQVFVCIPGALEGLGACFPKSWHREVKLFIGPEGGFSPAEIHAFVSQGAIQVSLAPYVLRAETASLTALAQIQGAFL